MIQVPVIDDDLVLLGSGEIGKRGGGGQDGDGGVLDLRELAG
jgi:hypothetical protein